MIFFIYPILQNQIINQINKYNYNTTIIFFNPDATSFTVIYCGFKRIIKGIKEKRVLRPKTVVEREGFSFCFITSKLHHCRYREAGLLINSLVIPFISPYYPPCITLFTTILPPFFTSLYN